MFGARPHRRTIERRVANPLSRQILSGELAEGDTALVDHAEGQYVFEKKKGPRESLGEGGRQGGELGRADRPARPSYASCAELSTGDEIPA